MGRKPLKKTKKAKKKAEKPEALKRAYPTNENGVMVFPKGMHPRELRMKREQEAAGEAE